MRILALMTSMAAAAALAAMAAQSMRVSNLLGYMAVAVVSGLVGRAITRHGQKQEVEVAFNEGHETGSFTSALYNDEYDDDFTDGSAPATFRPESSYERPYYEPEPKHEQAYAPSLTALEVHDQVDQFCRDMDSETDLYLAQMAAQATRVRASFSSSLYDRDATGPIPRIIAREVQVTTREVVLSTTDQSA